MYLSETNRPKKHQYAQGGFKKTIEKYEDLLNPKTGKIETKIIDVEDFYEIIQSHKDAQILESIIKRYEIDIDKKQIKEIEEDIIDMTAIPKTMTEAYSIIKQVEKEFDDRPVEIKRAFNNNVGEYVAGIQNGRLKQVLEEYQNKNGKAKKKAPTLEEQNNIQHPVQQTLVNQETIAKMVEEQIKNNLGGINNA